MLFSGTERGSTQLPDCELPDYRKGSFCSQLSQTCVQRLAVAVLAFSTILLCAGQRAWCSAAARTSAPEAPAAADQKGTKIVIPASLNTVLDSKKRNAGDQVEAKTAAPVHLPDGTLIPRGAKLMGHITEAKARSKGDTESSLGLVFDSIAAPRGRTINIKASPRAVAPNPSSGESDGGIGYGDLKQTVSHSQPGDQSQPVAILDEQSVGVHGIKNLSLGSDGLLHSDGKTVKLDHGSQMILQAEVAAQ
jgi:hypothetical protein